MNTSQTGSCTARFSIALVKSTIGFSVMPMCRILPFAFCSSSAGAIAFERIVVFVDLHAVQIEHVDIVGAHQAERIVEARDHALGRRPWPLPRNLRLGGDHDLVARDGLQRTPDHALGAVARRGVDEVDAEPDGLVDQPRGFVLGSCRP